MQFVSNHNRLLQGGVVYTGSNGDMWVSGLEYSGDKITGYSGSAFGGSTECPCDSAAIVDSAYDKTTAWVNEQEFITAHQDVSNLPYVQNSALDYNGLLISGISGDGLYALSAENAFTAEFAYNSQMADSAQTAIYAQSANSALQAEYSNIAYTALSSNNIIGLEYDSNGKISGFNGSAFTDSNVTNNFVANSALNMSDNSVTGISGYTVGYSGIPLSSESGIYIEKRDNKVIIGYSGDSTEYSAGTNIDITNNVISGKSWISEIVNASAYAYNQATAQIPSTVDYSAGNNIDITNHVVSGKDWTNEITAASAYAYEQSTGTSQEYSAGTNIDITNHVISGKSWTNDITAASAYAYEQATAQMPAAVEYSAGANIDITNHVVSGKSWTNDITAASSYAYAQATAQIPTGLTGAYVENSALKLTGNNVTGISSYEVGAPQVPVTGSGSVTVTSGNNQVIIYGESIGGTASIFTGGTYSDKDISSINFKQAGGSDAESIAFNYSGGSISSQLIPMTTEAGFLYCPGTGRRITTANPDYKYVPITTASAGATIYITSYPNEVITFITMGDNVNTGVDTTATIVGPFASITMESGMWVTFSRYFSQSHGLAYAQLGSGWIGGNYI